jgi:hypothetical protein
VTIHGCRFVPLMRAPGVGEGLAARLADPLWLLARQWQFGEFRGDDAGSPVSVTGTGIAHLPSWWRPEPDPANPTARPWQPWTVDSGPLEALVEAEPDDAAPRRRLRLDAGVRARRALVAAGLGHLAPALARAAPWPAADRDGASGPDRVVLAAVADGAVLAGRVAPWSAPHTAVPAALVAELGVAPAETERFAAALRDWYRWWVPRGSAAVPDGVPDPPSWDRHRLEHGGSLAFDSVPDVRLRLTRHPGGRLDWYSVDADLADPAELPAGAAQPLPVALTGTPQPATFAGMAAARFWEFENAVVDYGAVDASTADLARLLLVEYTTVYGNDWFVLPLRLAAGALVRLDTVRVVDSFGEPHDLDPANERAAGCRLFALHAPDRFAARQYWVAPALPSALEGPPLEAVTLRRDEMANVAWAVLDTLADGFGRPGRVTADPAPAAATADPPRYRAQTAVPSTWYPVLPEPIGDDPDASAYRLRLAALVRRTGGRLVKACPDGALLRRDADRWWIHEEELGRTGMRLERRVQVARWHDGRRTRWIARSTGPDPAAVSSGLRWDVLEPDG